VGARDVILRFGLRALDRGLEAVRSIRRSTRASAREAEDVERRTERLSARATAAGLGLAVRRRVREQAGQIPAAWQRAGDLGQRGLGLLGAARALAGGDFLPAAGLAAGLVGGPAGTIVAVASAAVGIFKPFFDKEIQRQRAGIEENLLAELDRRLLQFDIARRLREDPVFEARQARRFAEELRRQDAAVRANPDNQRWLREPGGLSDL
jgi:hypothetical protein